VARWKELIVGANDCWIPSPVERAFGVSIARELFRIADHLTKEVCKGDGWNLQGTAKDNVDRLFAKHRAHPRHTMECSCTKISHNLYGATLYALAHTVVDAATCVGVSLLSDRTVAMAWETSLRELLEASGQLAWCLDPPSTSQHERVIRHLSRLYLLRMKSDIQSDQHGFTTGHADLTRSQAAAMGFDFSTSVKDVTVCKVKRPGGGGEIREDRPPDSKMPGFINSLLLKRTMWAVDDFAGVYGIVSGVSHARLYRYYHLRTSADHDRAELYCRYLGLAASIAGLIVNEIIWALGLPPTAMLSGVKDHSGFYRAVVVQLRAGKAPTSDILRLPHLS
jgi:hypothetical protein